MSEIYLITGGAGNLACQLTFSLCAPGRRLVLFDLAEGPLDDVADGCEFIRGDLTSPLDMRSLFDRIRPTVVIHFASLLSGSSEADRSLAWRVNMDGTFQLFELALQYGVRTFFFPSSVAVYGGEFPAVVHENTGQWPVGLYGVTKLAIERLGHYYHCKHGLDFRCLRLPVVVSRHAPSNAASAYASRAFVEAALHGQFCFRVKPTTCPSLIYVRDVLRAIVMLLAAPQIGLSQCVYNIQSISPSAQEIADAIQQRWPTAAIQFSVNNDIAGLIESWPQVLDDTAARRDWNWLPQYDLTAMADDLWAELRSN